MCCSSGTKKRKDKTEKNNSRVATKEDNKDGVQDLSNKFANGSETKGQDELDFPVESKPEILKSDSAFHSPKNKKIDLEKNSDINKQIKEVVKSEINEDIVAQSIHIKTEDLDNNQELVNQEQIGQPKIVELDEVILDEDDNLDDIPSEIDKKEDKSPINHKEGDIDSISEMDNELNDNDDDRRSISNHSVISSYVLTMPKMITGIRTTTEQSYAPSMCSRSDLSILDTQNGIFFTEFNKNPFGSALVNYEDTEYEITNEHVDNFQKFIETPKSSNVFFPKSISGYNGIHNPQYKDVYERLNKKEKEIIKLNEKINKVTMEINNLDEENRKIEQMMEKEETEGEMLRHMLNYLLTKVN